MKQRCRTKAWSPRRISQNRLPLSPLSLVPLYSYPLVVSLSRSPAPLFSCSALPREPVPVFALHSSERLSSTGRLVVLVSAQRQGPRKRGGDGAKIRQKKRGRTQTKALLSGKSVLGLCGPRKGGEGGERGELLSSLFSLRKRRAFPEIFFFQNCEQGRSTGS